MERIARKANGLPAQRAGGRPCSLALGLAVWLGLGWPAPVACADWEVGAAKVDITPGYAVRLSGYGGRRTESEGVTQRLYAKALAIGSDAQGPAVLVTVDNCGVPYTIRDEVVRRLAQQSKVVNDRFALCSSHTHCAPMLVGVLPNIFSMDIPPEHGTKIERYTRELTDKIEEVALAALANRRPARLDWGVGQVGFAANRRSFPFKPVDHDLPVLRVTGTDGGVRAVLTSYACHCTVLAFNTIHGDWAGCAQEALEREFPGAIALTALGCGADQNPDPRRTYELATRHGESLAAEAKRLVTGELQPINGPLDCRTKRIQLPFDKLPTRAGWEQLAQSQSTNIAYHAKKNLARLGRGEKLPTHLPYLVQTWNFGDSLAMVFLPGEVVVDYGLRLKKEFDAARLWVNAYANDVPCYIPSQRVLEEGGYEGATAMLYYDRPTKFAPPVEDLIIAAVHDLVPKSYLKKSAGPAAGDLAPVGLAFKLTSNAQAQTASSVWQLVHVPGATNFTGVAWYRTWVKVHDSFFTRHERNLYEESVGLNIRDLAGAHEVWVNGRKIGAGGGFPPDYQSGREMIHRHKVPVGTLRKGEWNEIAIRVYNPSGPGGFLGEAPFIMNYFMESVFEGPWEFRPGDGYQPGGAVTNKPATTAFDTFRESNRVLGRTEQVPGARLSPQESLQQMEAMDDLKIDLLLHEPLVAQPVHFSFDERGRLWVAQYRQYPYPAGLTMVSRDKFYRSHYDKVPPAPPHHDRGADLISIHEDTDGDGVFDKHKVFQDGLNMANAVVRGRGGVWVMHTPYLLFYPDKNFDDVPDGPPVVHLAGFGLEDSHSIANGLVWGMDGWLYGAQGSTTSCRVRRPGLDAPDSPGVYFEGCMVWRYHPETRAFEIFSEGGGNTFGLELDAQGRLFSGHNGGKTRGWHFVQGGFYLMQGAIPGKFGPPRNPYAFGDLPMMATTNDVVRFTHFGAFAEGTAMPSQLAGLLFGLDPLHNVVIASERKSRGATFETVDRGPVAQSADAAFRPVYIANAPDGSLYVADLYDYYIAHGQHYQNQIDPTTGRIYRLRGKDAKLETDLNLAAKTTDQLIAILSHPNKWHRHTAVRVLGERKDPQASAKLQQLVARNRGLGALNALWALHQSVGLDEATVLAGLQHAFAPVRMWTVRLLGDEWGVNRNLGVGRYAQNRAGAQPGTLPAKLFDAVMACARAETDPEVLAQVASTARRLNAPQALPFVAAVLAHDEAVNDPFIPLLCWWVFEAHLPAANAEVLALFKSRALWEEPMVFEHILPRLARRYAVEDRRSELLLCAQLFRSAPSPKQSARLMEGFEEAFRGRAMTGLPDELVAAITASGQAPLIFRLKQGDTAAVAEALKLVQDAKAKADDRLLFVRAFGEVYQSSAMPALLAVAGSSTTDPLRKAALAALLTYDDESVGRKVTGLLPQLKGDVQTAAFTLLASRAKWSAELLDAVQAGTVKAASVPDDVANRLRGSKDEKVSELAARLLPKQAPMAVEFQKRIEEITAVLKRGTGNPYAGEATFMERCAVCHKLFFKGGNAGPDLTVYQRDNLDTMLPSIINPNAEIREGFEYYVVETRDGRSLSGFIVDRDNQVTVLRGLEGENITLRASEIEDLQPMGRSLMPEGLLEGLDEKKLRDLFAYLRISQPITK